MQKFGCPERFTQMVHQLPNDMMERVTDNGAVSEGFAVTEGVKQGCVLAPYLFSIMFSVMLMDAIRDERPGIRIAYRMDGKLLNHRRMHFKSHVFITTVYELLFADYCTLNATTEEGIQRSMNHFAATCDNFGLTSNTEKMVIMRQPPTDSSIVVVRRCPPYAPSQGGTVTVTCAPPSEPVSCLMWEWAHWMTGQRTRLRAPQHDLAPISHTPGFTKSGDVEEPWPSESQSTGQPLITYNTHWAGSVVWCKHKIGSLPSYGF
ncbi:unnamed protein product [Schistocephalus solidus]|uniref:Reverse transcriptase domain-containing protein n=1 Tax=Schistocephalus solidus TaxID=70667 RepID=A0A183TMS5_SCHSO|nr:unnamed protein product [Schistocephalus solidus]